MRIAMRHLLSILSVLLSAPLLHAQSLALTFDDGPRLDRNVRMGAVEKNRAILNALKSEGVSSVLFAAGRLVDSPEGLALVRAWAEEGHRVANHSYLHGYFNRAAATLDAFEADLLKDEALLEGLPGYTKWFRFPFLKEGDTAAKRDGARAFLRRRGYRNAHVTIDASDWYYDQRLETRLSREPEAETAPYRQAYLDHLWDRAQYYQELAERTLGRDVRHVLLLHHNLINALFLPDVIRMFRQQGWTIVSPSDAYQDPLYRLQPDVLPAGESLLWALAKEKGLDGLRYPGEDERYEKPLLDALGL
jgi:peptidoglycan/xylan/chitin deacetylase (PgdA/CDA1 family)